MNIILYIWQLPQNILGLLFRAIFKGDDYTFKDVIVRSCEIQGAVSLGKYILVNKHYVYQDIDTNAIELVDYNETLIYHEYGHCVQSRYLGWLYLLVIGIPSFLWACVHTVLYKCGVIRTYMYLRFYTERWAETISKKLRSRHE